jgi:hypothetical protein
VPHHSRRAAVSLLETTAAHRSRVAAARLQAVPHRSLLATGSLLAASLLPSESTWVARLQDATVEEEAATGVGATAVAPYIGAAAAVLHGGMNLPLWATVGAALTAVAHGGRLPRAPLPAADRWR